MSNITLFKNGNIAVPEYLQQTDDTTRLLADSGGKSISIKGGVWRMVVGGDEIARNEERALNMIVLAVAPHDQRIYHKDKYVEGQTSDMTCWSSDGVHSNAEVPEETRQSRKCADCPQNIAGSGENNSRACRYSRRIAVALENDIEGNVYRLQVPATSLFGKAEGDRMGLKAYATFLAGHNVPITGVVTEAKFDTAQAVPTLQFRAVRPLARDEWESVNRQAESADAANAIELKGFATKAAKTNEPAPNSEYQEPAAPAPAPAPVAAKKTTAKKAAAPAPVAEPDPEPAPEPTLRPSKAPSTAPGAEPSDSGNARVQAVLSDWLDDDDA